MSAPVMSLSEWETRVSMSPLVHACNITPVSHTRDIIQNTTSEVSVSFKNPQSKFMKHWVELHQKKGNVLQKLQNRDMVYTVDQKVHVDIRLPEKGEYILKILGKHITPSWPDDEDDDDDDKSPAIRLFEYKIESKGSTGIEAFPKCDGVWGMAAHFKAANFDLISHKSPVIVAQNGTCKIEMKLPIRGVIPLLLKLDHPNYGTSDLEKCMLPEKVGNKATFHIKCPEAGEYRFVVSYRPQDRPEKTGYYTGAGFLIQSKAAASNPFCFGDGTSLGGPLPPFYTKFGLQTDVSSSILDAKNAEEMQLVIKKTIPVNLFAKLHASDGKSVFVNEDSNEQSTTFNITIPGKGYHFFKLYACEENQNSGPQVATYCIKK